MASTSSTMSTFPLVAAAGAKGLAGTEDSRAGCGPTRFAMNVSLNLLPAPGALSTPRSPPMSRA